MHRMCRILALISVGVLALCSYAAGPPQAEISNQQIRAKLYLPDAKEGFYRSTRFDWSGVIHSLIFQGHDYYGPWFTKYDPSVRDFAYRDGEIVVGEEHSSKSVSESCGSRTRRRMSR
jgi:hypothetical protein